MAFSAFVVFAWFRWLMTDARIVGDGDRLGESRWAKSQVSSYLGWARFCRAVLPYVAAGGTVIFVVGTILQISGSDCKWCD